MTCANITRVTTPKMWWNTWSHQGWALMDFVPSGSLWVCGYTGWPHLSVNWTGRCSWGRPYVSATVLPTLSRCLHNWEALPSQFSLWTNTFFLLHQHFCSTNIKKISLQSRRGFSLGANPLPSTKAVVTAPAVLRVHPHPDFIVILLVPFFKVLPRCIHL